jgi:3-hydroxyisobutyrate dehydrogenase
MRVGFIGLGIMGASMASNVQEGGHELVVHDLRTEAAKPHLAAGARWARTPREAAEASDVVLTSLPGPPEVEAVALGDDRLLAGLRPGQRTSTCRPTRRPSCAGSTRRSPGGACRCSTLR